MESRLQLVTPRISGEKQDYRKWQFINKHKQNLKQFSFDFQNIDYEIWANNWYKSVFLLSLNEVINCLRRQTLPCAFFHLVFISGEGLYITCYGRDSDLTNKRSYPVDCHCCHGNRRQGQYTHCQFGKYQIIEFED